MARMKIACAGFAIFTCVLLSSPSSASAQQSLSSIVGVVRDAAGVPVAGVKVEATSGALIEKVRTAVTDGQGEYKIINLPVGMYDVIFSAAGFTTLRTEGIDLPSAFNASLNGQLTRGNPTETISVKGTITQVDTTGTTSEQVITAEQQQTLPTGQTSAVQGSAQLNAGLRVTDLTDVGGAESAQGQRTNTVSYHGKTGIRVQFDGLRSQNFCGGGYPAYVVNMSMVQDTSVQSSGMTAEYSSTGTAVNMIPKSGSNTWKFAISGLYTGGALVGDNLTSDLQARGLTSTSKSIYKYDAGDTWGGPISKDTVWIFQSNRYYGSKTQWAGIYYNATEGTPFYTNDLSRPAYRKEWTISPAATRITWQTSTRQKLNLYADLQRACTCQAETVGGIAPEAVNGYDLWPTGGFMATWQMAVNSKLLLEAGASAFLFHFPSWIPPEVTPGAVSILESSTNIRYNSATSSNAHDINYTDRYGQRFTLSYVTGSHALKFGVTDDFGLNWNNNHPFGNDPNGVSYVFNKGVPTQVVETALPYYLKLNGFPELGIFAQDKWTVKRLTINYGLRYDYFQGYAPAQHADAGPYPYSLPARDYAAVHDIPNWKDLTPRVGVAYDLFGNGRTALKWSFAKYLNLTGSGIVSANNPITTSVTSVTRAWADTNNNYVPDCNFANPGQNGECGAISDTNFGLNNPKANRFDANVLDGWGSRATFYEWGAEVQHQLRPGFTVSAGYFHNWVRGFTVTDNQQQTPADYAPYCITSPVDSRLPGGGGQQVCGMYDVSPAKFNSITNVVTKATPYVNATATSSGVNCGYNTPGNATSVAAIGYDVCGTNDFINLGLNARLARGIRVGAGFDAGRTEKNTCFVVDSPQQLLYCDQVNTFGQQVRVTANVTYPLPFPGQWTVSAAYQDNPGPQILANYNATTTEIAPSLGRNLAACGTRVVCTSTASVPLIQPFTQFDPRRHQLDLRLAKNFALSPRARLNASIGLFNATNSAAVVTINTTYGSQWLQPQAVLAARTLQFQGTLSF